MSLLETTAPLRTRLAALRARARALLLAAGLSRTIAYLLLAGSGHFLADYFFRLPVGARIIGVSLFLGGLLLVLVRHLLRPLASPLDDSRLAARAERAFPALRDRLASSLAFARAEGDPENFESRAMMRAVAEETVEAARGLPFASLARAAPALRSAGTALVLALLAGTFVSREPALFRIFLERNLLFRDTGWPRRTTLDVVGMEPGEPRLVTRGRDVTVEVRAEGSIPETVELAYWETAATKVRPELLDLSPTAEDPRLFRLTIPLYASTSFTVSGGDDDRREIHLLEALTPPSMLSIRMRCEFPAYLGREPEELAGGDQRLPQGTRVRATLTANMPLKEALLTVGAAAPSPLEREAPDRFGWSFSVDADLRYSLRLVGANGQENDPGRDTFVVRMLKDQAPVVRVSTPSARSQRLAEGILLVAFTARDDHRIAEARLHYTVAQGQERIARLGDPAGEAVRLVASSASRPDSVLAIAAIDLALLRRDDGKPLDRGDIVRFRIEAADSSGKVESTPPAASAMQAEVVSEEEIGREVQNLQQTLKETLDRARKQARDAGFAASTLKDTVDAAPAGLAEELRGPVGRAQSAQARVGDELQSLASQLFRIFNLHVFNRIDDRSAVEQLLPYFERHLLEPVEGTAAPFRSGLYRALWSASLDRSLRAGGALGKLLEMADLADRLAADEAPQAYRGLGAILRTKEAPAAAEALRGARAAQSRIEEGLDRLARLMGEWQNYESVVRFFKQLKERQRNIVETTKDRPEQR